MNLNEFVKNALEFSRSALAELESKKILGKYGVPVVAEKIVATSAEAVVAAADQILHAAFGMRILVQSQVFGNCEFVAGLFRDPLFGPALLFALGGILTEALSDVVFRLAPLSREDAADMIESVQSQSLPRPWLSEQTVDRQHLLQRLIGLSAIAADFPERRWTPKSGQCAKL